MAGSMAPIEPWKDVPLNMYEEGMELALTFQACLEDMSDTKLKKYARMWRHAKVAKQIYTSLGVGMYIAYQRECFSRGLEVY